MASNPQDFSDVIGRKIAKSIGFLFLGFIALVFLSSTIFDIVVVVPAGYVGVDYNAWSGINLNAVRSPGWSLKIPILQKVYMVKTARDTINLYPGGDDIAVTIPTKEGLMVTADVSVFYRVKPQDAPKIIQELTSEYKKGTLIPRIRSTTREITGNMLVTDIYGPGREKIQKDVYDKLKPMYEQDGFVIEEVLIRNIVMPPQISQAIEEKQAMEQATLKKGYELELTRKEAERKKIEGEGQANQQIALAEGQAKSQIALAKGQAESKLIVADAEARALEMVAETIRKNPSAYEFKKLQVTEELYTNPNTKFVALPSEQMIYQLPQSITQ